MPPADIPTNTAMLRAATRGDEAAEHDLLAVLHAELKGVASALLRGERADHTLQPTALVHEAWIRLVDTSELADGDRQRFFGLAVRAMRRVLIDHARRHRAQRRGGAWQRVQLDGDLLPGTGRPEDLLLVDELLERLAGADPRAAQVFELRVFGGLSAAETAAVMGLSERSARYDFTAAQAWLTRELARQDS